MTKAKKAPAKKKPAKKATKAVAKKADRVPTTPPPPVEKPLDWPKGLNSEKADALFAVLESGVPKSKAPVKVGLSWRSVYRWMKAHKDFADRVDEAATIGYQAMVDEIPEIADTANDKDSAAAANCRIQGRKTYLQLTAPHRYAMKQLQVGLGDGANGKPGTGAIAMVGLVIVPAKISGRGAPPTEFIDSTARVIVPAKTMSHQQEPTTDA